MSSRLGHLRTQLARLQRIRQSIRLVTAASVLLKSLVVILVFAFLADWSLTMTVPQRVVLLGLTVAALIWSLRRLILPRLRQSEGLVDLALQVERQHGIDSDLVSALQFERPEAAAWGSPQLEQVVVAQVADRSSQIDVMAGLPVGDLKRRLATCAVIVVLAASAVLLAPGHVFAFLQRLLLSDVSYPTRTVLDEIIVNGRPVTADVRSPAGHPVEFVVRASGDLPVHGTGRIRVVSVDGRVATEVALNVREGRSGEFGGELSRLTESVTFQVFLGDARSRSMRIDAVPLPLVELQLDVQPPVYAASVLALDGEPAGGAVARRQISVLPGSRVGISLRSLNKPLAEAVLQVDDARYLLQPQDSDGRHWQLDVTGTPFESIDGPLQYRLQATDRQGLSLENPLHGTVRLRADQSPRVSLSARTRRVIPTAQLPLTWSASDDFGLSRVTAQIQVLRPDGEVTETEIPILQADDPAVRSLRDTFRLDMAALQVTRGDEVRVTLTATDFRGDAEPQQSFSESVLLHVTDRQGILSGLLETDEDSAQQLDAIIRRELGIGETR